MKSVSTIADEIIAICPTLCEDDRAKLRWAIVATLIDDRTEINQLIQTRLKTPQYAISKLIEEIEELLLSEGANNLTLLFTPQSDPAIASDSLGLGGEIDHG
jgi:hypothetical protein